MLSCPCSNYLSIPKLNETIKTFSRKRFSLLHCNLRSLTKNLHLLEELLCSLDQKPDIVVISETKLNENSIIYVDMDFYNFYHSDSKTNTGGVGLSIAKNMQVNL